MHRQSWQRGVEAMTDETDVTRVYQGADSADDKIEGTQRVVCLVPILQQPTTVPLYCQPLTEGDIGSRDFFVMSC